MICVWGIASKHLKNVFSSKRRLVRILWGKTSLGNPYLMSTTSIVKKWRVPGTLKQENKTKTNIHFGLYLSSNSTEFNPIWNLGSSDQTKTKINLRPNQNQKPNQTETKIKTNTYSGLYISSNSTEFNQILKLGSSDQTSPKPNQDWTKTKNQTKPNQNQNQN